LALFVFTGAYNGSVCWCVRQETDLAPFDQMSDAPPTEFHASKGARTIRLAPLARPQVDEHFPESLETIGSA